MKDLVGNELSLGDKCYYIHNTKNGWNLENYNSHINNLERVNEYCKQNNITIEQYLQGEWRYKQEMDNIKFCDCGCIINSSEYQCDDCKEEE